MSPSKNQLQIEIQDCPKDSNDNEGAECVQMLGELSTPQFKLQIEAMSTHGFHRDGSSSYSFGNISEAYQGGVKLLIDGLERQYEKASKKYSADS